MTDYKGGGDIPSHTHSHILLQHDPHNILMQIPSQISYLSCTKHFYQHEYFKDAVIPTN